MHISTGTTYFHIVWCDQVLLESGCSMSSSSEKDIVREMKDGYEDDCTHIRDLQRWVGIIMPYQENLCYVCSGDWKTEMQCAQEIHFLISFYQKCNSGLRHQNIDYSWQQKKEIGFQCLGAAGGVVLVPPLACMHWVPRALGTYPPRSPTACLPHCVTLCRTLFLMLSPSLSPAFVSTIVKICHPLVPDLLARLSHSLAACLPLCLPLCAQLCLPLCPRLCLSFGFLLCWLYCVSCLTCARLVSQTVGSYTRVSVIRYM